MKKQVKAWLPDSGWSLRPLFGGMIAGLLALMSVLPAQAGIIKENAAVTTPMDATGGTEQNPNVFLFNVYTNTFASFTVGSSNPWNELHILGGSKITSTGAAYVGSNVGSDHSRILVLGTGSSLQVDGELRLGDRSVFNRIDVEDGGELIIGSQSTIGYRATVGLGNDCGFVVDDATVKVRNKLIIGYNANNVRNYILVRNGGTLEIEDLSAARIVIGRQGSTNDITLVGRDSRLLMGASANNLSIPETPSTGHECTLTLIDAALARIDKNNSTAISVGTSGVGGNRVRFAAGFLAWNGDQRASLNVLTQVSLWNGTAYVTPGSSEEATALKWSARYYTVEEEAAALLATGYSGLGGYTVFTGGKSIAGALKTTLVVVK